MKLEVECTWNEKRNKAKQVIHFDFLPKTLFAMPKEPTLLMQQYGSEVAQTGPPVLAKMEGLLERYPKSLYAQFTYYRALHFFQLEEEALEQQEKINEAFPGQVYTQCMIANKFLEEKKLEKFSEFFKGVEVLKGAFPKRKVFYFEEALFFHYLWISYFEKQGDGLQSEKHKKFAFVIMQTHQTYQPLTPA